MGGAAKAEGDRIASLLEELRSMAGPTTWQRLEELLRRLVTMYGTALERVLWEARQGGALDPDAEARLCADELVSSLLLLHGLHPVPAAERVARAVAALGAQLGPEITIALVGLGEDGVVRLRMEGAGGGCGEAALARGVENAVLEAAPEVARVEITGIEPPRRERLVTLGAAPRGAGFATE
jgi:Fe-S cluster biogenesis protein NfuA